MDYFIKDIIDNYAKLHKIPLPPIQIKQRKNKKKLTKNSQTILFDEKMRSKALSVLQSYPIKLNLSSYKTSRLSVLSKTYLKDLKNKTLAHNIKLTPINFSYSPVRLSQETPKKSIKNNLCQDIEKSFSNNLIALKGSKKRILKKLVSEKSPLKNNTKNHVKLGTEFSRHNSKEFSDNDSINEYFTPLEKAHMRRSTFTFND